MSENKEFELSRETREILAQLNDATFRGYKVGDLRQMFERVVNQENWKMPIDATINSVDVEITLAAIDFFAGGGSQVSAAGDGFSRITAPGYYYMIGA